MTGQELGLNIKDNSFVPNARLTLDFSELLGGNWKNTFNPNSDFKKCIIGFKNEEDFHRNTCLSIH